MEGRLIDWAELVELHVIKKLSQVINRRWNLQLIFVTDDHKLIAIGEAQAPRDAVVALAPDDRAALIRFLESL